MTYFSLIVPFHISSQDDRRAYIDALLNSLPDRADLEVLLVDDHSEIPLEPAHELKKTNVRIVPNRRGQRFAGTARNTGMEEAAGTIIFFADSDDLFFRIALEKVLDLILEESDWDLYIARLTSFTEDGACGNRHEYIERAVEAFCRSGNCENLIHYHNPAAKFIRRSFLKRCDLHFAGTRVGNDVLFAVKLALAHPDVRVINEVVYALRQGNPSLTSDVSAAALRQRLSVHRSSNAFFVEAQRPDLRIPLYFHYRRYWEWYWPSCAGIVIWESARALVEGDLVFPDVRIITRDIRTQLAFRSRGRAFLRKVLAYRRE